MRGCSARVTSDDCRAPLTGNELYLNGLNSGTMPSQAALAKGGKIAGSPANPAKRAISVTPIIGEISTTRAGRVQARLLDRVERVLHRQRATVRVADDVQRPPRAGPSHRLAHREPGRRGPILPMDLAQARRDRAVPGKPWHDRHEAAVPITPRDLAHAVGRVGEAVQEDDRADRRPGRLQQLASGSSRGLKRPG